MITRGDGERDLRPINRLLIVARIHEASCRLRVQLLDVLQAPDIVDASNTLLRCGQRGLWACRSVRSPVNLGDKVLAAVI